ncbi:SMI1/KNR4 family protein [Mechercharimyces sp. CAU 1602]|uniref:SMI1/KNR4 family protein n=1 Tax=Mechercharimyces sp. CAU 1602 TaxID=2973933 RepID=UPI002163C9A1|nr:SMI1/KNR4 family protein [Mechercharimyces sp. CAU 1602]MCS1350310.1 SMI1/KNR4 family protein [Mechercharimyces sp. CAU 1602]
MKWEYVKPIDEQKIKEIESELKVKFPKAFVSCVRDNNGGRPETHTVYDLGRRKGKVFGELFDFYWTDDGLSIIEAHEISIDENELPEEIIPFGIDPAGDFFCFDYRHLINDEPIVVLYNHDREYDPGDEGDSLTKIADSFSDFLSMLYEPEE